MPCPILLPGRSAEADWQQSYGEDTRLDGDVLGIIRVVGTVSKGAEMIGLPHQAGETRDGIVPRKRT